MDTVPFGWIIADGELFEKLEQASGGKLCKLKFPVQNDLPLSNFAGEALPWKNSLDYIEFSSVIQLDGRRVWMRTR